MTTTPPPRKVPNARWRNLYDETPPEIAGSYYAYINNSFILAAYDDRVGWRIVTTSAKEIEANINGGKLAPQMVWWDYIHPTPPNMLQTLGLWIAYLIRWIKSRRAK